MSKTGENSRFPELRTPTFSLRIAPVVHVALGSLTHEAALGMWNDQF